MKVSVISETGGRKNNEDAVGRLRANGKYCFVLADGIGGQDSGDVASELAVQTVLNCFKAQPDISPELMYAYLEAAQNAIIEERAANTRRKNMGTTITVLITDGSHAIWAHCGDSRIYRLKKHLIQEITDDHSVAFMSFMAGEIRYKDIRINPDQNKLLRSLSDGQKFKPDISDIVKLPSKTSFLLCSDGFWEYVDEDFMEVSRKKTSTPRAWLDAMLEERKRNAPSDADNYSAIAVFI